MPATRGTNEEEVRALLAESIVVKREIADNAAASIANSPAHLREHLAARAFTALLSPIGHVGHRDCDPAECAWGKLVEAGDDSLSPMRDLMWAAMTAAWLIAALLMTWLHGADGTWFAPGFSLFVGICLYGEVRARAQWRLAWASRRQRRGLPPWGAGFMGRVRAFLFADLRLSWNELTSGQVSK